MLVPGACGASGILPLTKEDHFVPFMGLHEPLGVYFNRTLCQYGCVKSPTTLILVSNENFSFHSVCKGEWAGARLGSTSRSQAGL